MSVSIGGPKTSTIFAWAYIAVLLSLLIFFSSFPVTPNIQVGGQTPVQGTAGENVTERPYSHGPSTVLLNDTPFSSNSPKWTITNNGLGYLDEAQKSITVVMTNLTELICSATFHLGKGPMNIFVDFNWLECNGQDARTIGYQGDVVPINTGETRSWSTALLISGVRNQTLSGVVSLDVSIRPIIPIHSAPDSGPVEILGFSLVGTYNATLSPVAFDVRTTDGYSLFPQGETTRQRLGGINVSIANRESLVPFFFRVEDSNETHLLPPGNYAGGCSWDTGYPGDNVSINASIHSNSTVQWIIRVPSARIHLDFVPEIPNRDVHVVYEATSHAGVGSQSGPLDILLAPGAKVWVIAFVYFNPTGFINWWRNETLLTLEGAVAVNVVIEAPYVVFGPVALVPITCLFIVVLSLSVLFVIISKRKELRTLIRSDLSVMPGLPSLLFLVLSLVLPWPTSSVLASSDSYATIPFIMQNLWWNQQTITVITAMPLWNMIASGCLWAAAAISSMTLNRKDKLQGAGLLAACVAVALVLVPAIYYMQWNVYSLLGPIAVLAAVISQVMVWRFVMRNSTVRIEEE